MNFSRRELLKLSSILASLLFVSKLSAKDDDKNGKISLPISKKAPLPKKRAPRVVVVGGGWAGLSVAKHVKVFAPQSEVILVEQKDIFISCPVSNLWLVDKVELDFITHDYLKAARANNYTYFHATAIGIDKKKKILKTSLGEIDYDYLVLAPGIDYDYSCWSSDEDFINRLYTTYPPAFKPGSEHWTLKRKIHSFKGGTFLFTVPSGNYRCLPAPYERACIVADFFKQKGIKAKVLLLDENNDITIKEHGFHTAFEELYKDIIEYVPNAKIESIDLDKKIVYCEFDDYKFDDASFYPHVRGAKLLEILGVAKDSVYNKLEGDIDPLTYEVKGDENIFICGDARPMGFSKSGNTAHSEGQNVAKIVASKINKSKKEPWRSPLTLCISAVSIAPERGIFIHSEYAYDKKKKSFYFATPVTKEIWQGKVGEENAKYIYNWAKSLYIDMFGS
jgi:hypothetical protein